MTKRNQNKIQAILDLASVAEQVEGLNWYKNALEVAEQLGESYDLGGRLKAIGVLAALSPRNRWERNIQDAEQLIDAYTAGGPQEAALIKVCTFGANKKKAISILELRHASETDILAILSGPKVQEFYRCIFGLDDVCIDGHAYCIWNGCRTGLADVPNIGVKLRRQIKEDYRAVAERNNLTGFQVQAITWLTYRRLHGITK
jgi:hypothetical protein